MQIEPDVEEEKGKKQGKRGAGSRLYVDPDAVTLIGDGLEQVSMSAVVFTTDPTMGAPRPDPAANRTLHMTVERTDLLTLEMDQAPSAFGRQATLRASRRLVGDEPLTATVHATAQVEDETLTETIQVTLEPLRPELKLEPASQTVVADGETTTQIKAQVLLYGPDGILLDVDPEATARIQFEVEPTEVYTLKPCGPPTPEEAQISLGSRELRSGPLPPARLVARVMAGGAQRTERLTISAKPVEARLLVAPETLELPADGQSTFTLCAYLEIRHDGGLWREAGGGAQISITVADPALLTVTSQVLEANALEAEIGSSAKVQHPTDTTVQVRATAGEEELAAEIVKVLLKPAGALEMPGAVRPRPEERAEKEPVPQPPEKPGGEALYGEQPETWVCTNCGVENRDRMRFCTKCGMPKSAALVTWVCADCGAKNREGMHFCTQCGAVRRQVVEWICPHCQKPNAATMAFCTGCGRKQEERR